MASARKDLEPLFLRNKALFLMTVKLSRGAETRGSSSDVQILIKNK